MKITQIMLGKGFGGAERYFVDLSRALAASGHQVQTICHRRFKQSDQLRSDSSITVAEIAPWGWWDILAQGQIRNLVAGFRPQVIHAHLARSAHLAGASCRQLNIPLVVKTHNYIDLKYYRDVRHFITTTHDQQRYLQSQGVETDHVSVIPNFSSMLPVEAVRSKPHQTLQIVSYGRLVRKKGFHVLLQATRQLLDAGHSVSLRIGGDGPERTTLVNMSNRLGLQNSVEFTGWVDDVAGYVRGADLFVLPSLDEPFGIAILEMMARGVPIVATRTQGPLEILNEHAAWLVEPDNVRELVESIKQCFDHEVRRERASAALELFKHKYAEAVVVPEVVALYQKVSGPGSK